MWNIAAIIILTVEVLLLLSFILGRFQKRKLNETAVFIGIVFVISLSLHIVPYLYTVIVLGQDVNHVFGLLECFASSLKLFVGDPSVDSVIDFANAFPLFTCAYLLGIGIALLTTISTAVEAFNNSIRNSLRLAKALKESCCDIVVGNSPEALHYAKSCNAVLLPDDDISKETVNALIEDGYAVLRKSFTAQLLKHRQFNTSTRYNLVCPGENKALDYVDTFIAYKKSEKEPKNIFLYVEMEGDTAETVRREVIEKCSMEFCIDTFSTTELLARSFTEENPIAKYLPKEYIRDGAIRQGTQINVFVLGFGKLARELYRQSVQNNQLVTFDGEYKVLPVHYYLCDTNIDSTEWNIRGLAEALGELDPSAYFPIPELPFETRVIDKAPASREVLTAVKKQVQKDNSYTLVIIDTEEDCRNIEIGSKLRSLLFSSENYHIFVRSETNYTKSDAAVTYFGKYDSVFNHDVIVNDSLSIMAKKVNEVYTAQYADSEEKARPDFPEYIQAKAENDWNNLDYFTLYSNLYAAMNLRAKLNLLGLDYVKDGKGENTALIRAHHGHKGNYTYSEYFTPSVRNALIAQEHARWNAYHLLSEYLPLAKSHITVKADNSKKIRFNVKNTAAKQHACLTTYQGLNELSAYLAEKAGNGCTAADYDYYIYDETLLTSAAELLHMLGYSVTER